MSNIMIYADHAATTVISPVAYSAMQPWLQEKYGNPSTLYRLAREPRKAVASSREIIAECIGAKPEEIFFTSGGTEADNWALTGVAFRHPSVKEQIITSSIEHHAILHTCDFLARMGYQIEHLPVDTIGLLSFDALRAALTESTCLVSMMLANNEIGTIEPIGEAARIAHENGALFHTDAVQAVGHIPIDVETLGADLLSASAHKFNGPKGIGFLYIRKGVEVEPLIHGGGQESGSRAGTENVAGIVGMAAALQEHIAHMDEEAAYLNRLTGLLVTHLKDNQLDFMINGSERRIPGSLSLSFRDADGEMLLHRLDLMGTCVATGSACNLKESVLSHVIKAINVPETYAHGTIRITLGMDNTEDQMRIMANQIARILN